MTGIDRVEQAYLTEFLASDGADFGLVRTALGFLLLDRTGMTRFLDKTIDTSRIDLPSKFAWRKDPQRGRVETGLRKIAIARSSRIGLARLLKQHLPQGFDYYNVGHANLAAKTLQQIRSAARNLVVLVHDTIPLDFPEYCRADQVKSFARKLRAVATHADLVVHSTQAARADTEAHFARYGRVPVGVVANLGIDPTQPTPLGFQPAQPYFVCLGTIEPRKNHALLLDVWDQLPEPKPDLYIVGQRGWASDALFARLDALPAQGAIKICSDLTDGEVATLLASARALLFPSLAEGFGIPAIEAAARGTPLVLSNLAVFKEITANTAVYLEPEDRYSWLETIVRLVAQNEIDRPAMTPPSWPEHFNKVFTALP